MSLFINNDLNAAYHWPDGSALTPASTLKPTQCDIIYDLYSSDELGVGRKSYYINVFNRSPIAKTVHLHAALVFPTGNIT